ncbi:hypothetical protein [Paracoccus sp. SSK6]|uniref:hypothetical protein n=1 Tax=Paracoccus sp. SSK6 TaxID=3143131 RepID=UPI00321B5B7D
MEEEIEIITLVRFAVVDATGDILWIGQCPEEELPLQAYEPDHVVIANVPETVADDTHYYKDGFIQYPPKPGPWAVFDHDNEIWIDTRSPNKDDDFDQNDYSVDVEVSLSGDVLSWGAFVASRNNGIYVEAKTVGPGAINFAGNPVLIGYDWDSNAIKSYPDFANFYTGSRRILLGEFRGSGSYIPAANLINGNRVGAGTVETKQIAPASCNELATVYNEVEYVFANELEYPHSTYLADIRTRIDFSFEVEDDSTLLIFLSGFNSILGDLRPIREQIHSLSYEIRVDGVLFGKFGEKDPSVSEDLSFRTNVHAIPVTKNMNNVSIVSETGRLYNAVFMQVKR